MSNDTNDAPATRPASGNPRTIPVTEGATASASRENRKAIPVSCALHRGPRGFANLVVERKRDGEIVLDPHVLRHEALCCIPYRVGRDLEEYLWV